MTQGIEFQAWPKMSRLNRDIIITEKIDGTNAAIGITEEGVFYTQSRKRLITPDDDNFGFSRWAFDNSDKLIEILGPGLHFGEWWGSGIQRGYGLAKGEKRFSLFNTTRWTKELWMSENEGIRVEGLNTVPMLYKGPFSTHAVNSALDSLEIDGSLAASGFMAPEGVVVYHTAANLCLKATIENDELPKALVGA